MFKATLGIDGIACTMCETHVNEAIRKAFSVKKVSSSHKKGMAEVISDTPLDEAALRAALAPTGYRLTSFKSEPYEKKGGLFGFLK